MVACVVRGPLSGREQIAEESWLPPPIPEDVQLLPGFPGDEALGAAVFLAQCAADQGYADDKIKENCPFLLQVRRGYALVVPRLPSLVSGKGGWICLRALVRPELMSVRFIFPGLRGVGGWAV